MRQRIVYIAGLGHSGSTLLDLLLGTHEAVVGLGELGNTLSELDQNRTDRVDLCSCGGTAANCQYRSEVQARFDRNPADGLERRYRLAIETFQEQFGKDTWIADSSKSRTFLSKMSEVPWIELRVLHLVRDVRSYTISRVQCGAERRRLPAEACKLSFLAVVRQQQADARPGGRTSAAAYDGELRGALLEH